MPILVREIVNNKVKKSTYASWPHYKSKKGYSYPDPPTENLDSIQELKIAEKPCPHCWGQPYLTRAANGEGYVRSDCPRCIGTGFDFVF